MSRMVVDIARDRSFCPGWLVTSLEKGTGVAGGAVNSKR